MDDNELSELIDKYEHTNYTLTVGGPQLKGEDLIFSIVNGMSLYRVKTLGTKEPETLEWMLSLTPSDILFDVGANIGLFTIVAAKVAKATVYAFEPESQNYALLHRNIFMNDVHDKVWAFCAAVTDKFTMDKLYLSSFAIASSCHQFAKQVNFNLEEAGSMLGQGCIGIALDEAIALRMLPVPTHIKIDVDGFEHKVLEGARNLLQNRKLRSVIMEINARLPQHNDMFKVMEENGFTYSKTQMDASNCGHRVGDPRFEEFYNVIFTRS